MLDARIDMAHDGRKARAAEVVARLGDRRGARHLRQQLGRLKLIGCEGDAYMAVRHDAFIGAVCIHNLPNVLRHQVRFHAVASHI